MLYPEWNVQRYEKTDKSDNGDKTVTCVSLRMEANSVFTYADNPKEFIEWQEKSAEKALVRLITSPFANQMEKLGDILDELALRDLGDTKIFEVRHEFYKLYQMMNFGPDGVKG